MAVDFPFNIHISDKTFIDPDGDFTSEELIYSAKKADGKTLPSWIIFDELSRIQLPQQEKLKMADFAIKSQGTNLQTEVEIKRIIGNMK